MSPRGRRRGRRDRTWDPADPNAPFGVFAPNIPKAPPPEHGIRVGEVGTTWWGARWVEALVRFGAQYAARLHRGRTYARQGRVHDLTVTNGVVTALVTGSRPQPYRVKLALRPLSDQMWQQAIRAMAAKASFAAALLAGEMPRAIDQAFSAARASLFPSRREDLRTKCSCPDEANPCKHIAAVHIVLAEGFDRDPFLLFDLRGRSRDAVLGALRELRGGAAPTTETRRSTARPEPPRRPRRGVPFPDVPPEGYERLRGPIADLRLKIAAPNVEGALLRQLGTPPAWRLEVPFADVVRPAIARAADLAREIALEAPPATAEPGARRTRERAPGRERPQIRRAPDPEPGRDRR